MTNGCLRATVSPAILIFPAIRQQHARLAVLNPASIRSACATHRPMLTLTTHPHIRAPRWLSFPALFPARSFPLADTLACFLTLADTLLAHPFAALSISLLSAPSSRSLCLIHHAAPASDLPCCAFPAFSRLRPPGATALFDGESPPEAKPRPSYTLRAPAPPAARRIRASTCG